MAINRRQAVIGSTSLGLLAILARSGWCVEPYGPSDAQLNLVVMDPMAAPLACDCVQGYAQRKYEALADYIRERTGNSVRVIWSESLEAAVSSYSSNIQLVIGKDSVVRSDARIAKKSLAGIAQLTDSQGTTKQKGLFVVQRDNPAATLLDLDGYKIYFGPQDCDEKDSAPKKKLRELEVSFDPGEVCASCSVAAKQLMEHSPSEKCAAVISSYAAPLLEGCGTIKKGDLRVVGESDAVPFISVFADESVSIADRDLITNALLAMSTVPSMLQSLETKTGFVPYSVSETDQKKTLSVR